MRTLRLPSAVGLTALLVLCGPAPLAQWVPAGNPRLAAFETHAAMVRSSPYTGLDWSSLGPTNVSGRCTDVTVANRGGTNRIYAGYATGGAWQSDDGLRWLPMFSRAASTAIGDIAVAPSDPDVVWIGTGEANLYRVSYPGVGVYKSIDAGRTWRHMGLADTGTIGRIVIDPEDPSVVYVAAGGYKYAENDERGVFKTIDGGVTWTRVLFRSPRTGAIDLVIDPSDRRTLYAATWERIAHKWLSPMTDPASALSSVFKTTDAGVTWREAAQGLPPPNVRGRIGLDVSTSHPAVVYAYLDNSEVKDKPHRGDLDPYGRPLTLGRMRGAELYRSDDAASTWRKVNKDDAKMAALASVQGFSFGQVRVDPRDENTVYLLGTQLLVSHNGGKSFAALPGPHPDHHGLWIDPVKKGALFDCGDGGVFQSADSGRNWSPVTLPTTQFYNVELDTATPFHAYGSVQDDGSRRVAVALTGDRELPKPAAFDRAAGWEATNHAIDPADPSIVYAGTFYGAFSQYKGSGARDAPGDSSSQVRSIKPRVKKGEDALRGQWLAPILISPHDPKTLYVGYQAIYRSTNRAGTWDRISPDLTDHDPARFGPTPFAVNYQTITAIAESPRTPGVIYAGTDDGHLHLTEDGGATWTDLTANLPKRQWVSRVVASRYDPGTVYVTQRGREDDDLAPYVYRSTDFGKTFASIAGNIPFSPINVIREDPARPSVLYAGTDLGVYVSRDAGAHWDALGGNLPTVPVSDLQIHERDRLIVIATFGRGLWAMDAALIR